MSKNVKNQHYVPKMYLKRFTTDNGRFSVLKLKDNIILTRQRPENFAAIRYFYDSSKEELDDALPEMKELFPKAFETVDLSDEQFVEKALSRMESDLSKILDELGKDHSLLNEETYIRKLIIFIHDLAYRSEKFRNQIDNFREQTEKHLSEMGINISDVEGLEGTGKELQLKQMLDISPLLKTTKMLIENYNWYYGIVNCDLKLIISDNPAQGIIQGFNDICIPISSERAIILRVCDENAPLISKDMPKDGIIELSSKSVFAYNAIQMSYANKFVFGDKQSLLPLQRFFNRNN